MNNFGILIYPSIRAKIYLEKLVENGLHPSYAILLNNKGDLFHDLSHFCSDQKIAFDIIDTNDINDPKIRKILKKRKEEYFVFTGGGVLSKEIVSLKKFIHVHSGILPQYKGSTCIYYSLLEKNFCGATAFIMKPRIDSGDIIATKVFEKPSKRDIDYYYDPFIRVELLVDVIRHKKFKKCQPQKREGKMYYIIHPVLKHIVLLSIRA